MAKVLLVEDDNNLREIYQARLMAEGYTIVAAQDGEEALVMAKKEHPDLIISDVMMPRISGFEMLDILRNTDELKHTKVIMLTALGQAEDQTRADNLGADKYLVKSQVTLEDIVKSAEELLAEDGTVPTTATPEPVVATPATPASPTAITSAPAGPAPVAPAPGPAGPVSDPPAETAAAEAPATVPAKPTAPVLPAEPVAAAHATAAPVTPAPAAPPANDVAAPAAEPVAPPQPAQAATAAPEVDLAAAATASPIVTPPQTTIEPAVPEPTTVAAPISATVDNSSPQSLQAEEEALQKQIDNYAEEPGTDPPAAEPTVDISNDDAVLAQAVKQLNTPEDSAPVVETPPPITEPVLPPVEQAAASPEKLGDSSPIAGKKIIQPLTDPVPKPSLDELLAKEAAKEPPAPPIPVVDGNPTAQNPETPGFDPNSISL